MSTLHYLQHLTVLLGRGGYFMLQTAANCIAPQTIFKNFGDPPPTFFTFDPLQFFSDFHPVTVHVGGSGCIVGVGGRVDLGLMVVGGIEMEVPGPQLAAPDQQDLRFYCSA